MPAASHHVVCATDDESGVRGFLMEIMGLERPHEVTGDEGASEAVLGWPEGSPAASGSIFGRGPAGLLEVLTIPEALQGVVAPGTLLIAFAVDNIEAKVAACRERGLDVSDIIHEQTESVQASIAVVRVGGLAFELVRFGAPPAAAGE